MRTHPKTSVAGFVSWVEKQPAKTKYLYLSPNDCPYARYLRTLGMKDFRVGGTEWCKVQGSKQGEIYTIPRRVSWALSNIIRGNTYGALLERLTASRQVVGVLA